MATAHEWRPDSQNIEDNNAECDYSHNLPAIKFTEDLFWGVGWLRELTYLQSYRSEKLAQELEASSGKLARLS